MINIGIVSIISNNFSFKDSCDTLIDHRLLEGHFSYLTLFLNVSTFRSKLGRWSFCSFLASI